MNISVLQISLFVFTWILTVEGSDAFFPPSSTKTRRSQHVILRGGAADSNPINNGELVSTLARMDQQWKIQQAQPRGPKSRWSKILLDKDDDEENDESMDDNDDDDAPQQQSQDFVYLLEPPTLPSCIIVFLGGAGLGQFPHIAYSEFLTRVSDRLNAAVVAAPYTVGLDHFTIAKKAGEKLRKGILKCNDEKQYSSTLPTYCLGHSLGCKLSTIYMAATSQDYDGIGYIAYNNFGFSQTIGMARDFADQLRKASNNGSGGSTSSTGSAEGMLNSLFGLAETAVGALGLEFTPSPEDMRRLTELKYTNEWKKKTRLFMFDEDTLDTTPDFVASCGNTVDVSGLPGNHLTPVFLQLKLSDYMSDLPPEARGMASEAAGFDGASFGDEEDLDALVEEVCGFILGKGPSRRPAQMDSLPLIISGGEADESSS
eukprot:CAMPEP_0119028084 /NCGR_PEP_ID=MMETSP1176-20130426/38298_1 /TAXON_ID=265551 /ORGANISM="Synedropsis recta cf, Strain CCMP1620" /LENGTH=428 /DNA_ID=CAMNT_0006984143 /DNA_START=38 /DNA_END=1324 /DNA_ORIENTATION=-